MGVLTVPFRQLAKAADLHGHSYRRRNSQRKRPQQPTGADQATNHAQDDGGGDGRHLPGVDRTPHAGFFSRPDQVSRPWSHSTWFYKLG